MSQTGGENFHCHWNLTWHKSFQVHFKSCDFPNYTWSTTETINSVQERKSERGRAEILPNWPQFVTPPSRSCALSRDRSVLKSLRKPIPRLWLSPRLWPNVSQTVQNMQLRSMIVWSLASFAAPCVEDCEIFFAGLFRVNQSVQRSAVLASSQTFGQKSLISNASAHLP